MRNYYSTFTYYNSKYYESPVQCENIALIPRASIRAENQQQSATAFIVAFITMKTWTSAVVPAVPWIRKWIFAVKARKCETGLCTVKRARRVVHSAERNHVITNSWKFGEGANGGGWKDDQRSGNAATSPSANCCVRFSRQRGKRLALSKYHRAYESSFQ